PVRSNHINVTQTLALIERLIARDVHVVFLSTNQVFDGTTPHVPVDAQVCPISAYGRQKAQVEEILRKHMRNGAPLTILRLGKVVSPDMPLLHNWASALKSGRQIRAFHDMSLAPTPIGMAARAIGTCMISPLNG